MVRDFLCLVACIACALVILFPVNLAEAGRRAGYNGLEDGYVTAISRYGKGRISAPVRMRRLGPQVRLPSGHWTYCRRSCSETLRVKTVDKNAHIHDGSLLHGSSLGRECGILGCIEAHFGF